VAGSSGESRATRRSRSVCGAFFVGAGVLHLVRPRTFEQIVPPGFGDPHAIVLISGVAEIVGGMSLARRSSRWFSRWWLIGLLVAVFPANVYMAVDPGTTGSFGLPRWMLWARLPLQGVGIWWVWTVTRDKLRVQLPS
jgi:uncharacterized membrane protein